MVPHPLLIITTILTSEIRYSKKNNFDFAL